MTNKRHWLAELRRALHEEFELPEVSDLSAVRGRAGFLTRGRLELAGHFTPEYDVLVYDPVLATLGIVRIVEPLRATSGKAKDELKARVQAAVKEATYVRHLLVTDPSLEGGREPGTAARKQPLSVELVLVTPRLNEGLHRTSEQYVGRTLQDLAHRTPYLASVGVHLLRFQGGKAPYRDDLRRAFCWLLQGTRRWYGSRASQRSHGDSAPLRSLRTDNFRIAGTRCLDLDPEARIHLVSGRNGSGKSALVESVELAVTGRVERLEEASEGDEVDYRAVLTNHDHDGSARVSVHRKGKRVRRFRVSQRGTPRPLLGGLPAGAFRLNQRLMDRLVVASAGERAETFVRSFFPEPEHRQALERFREAQEADRSATKSLERTLTQLRHAHAILGRLKAFTARTEAAVRRDYRDALNEWLEACALADLVGKQAVIDGTLAEARRGGWPRTAPPVALPPALAPDARRDPKLTYALKREVDGVRERLENAVSPDVERTTKRKRAPRAALSPPNPEEVQALSEVGDLLFPAEELEHSPRLGQAIRGAVQSLRRERIGRFSVGTRGWATKLQARIQPLTDALERAAAGSTPPDWPGPRQPKGYEGLKEVRRELREASEALKASFLRAIGGVAPKDYGHFAPSKGGEPPGLLNAALNEVMALFTPARWAYQDIALGLNTDARELHVQVGEGEGSARAELRFNTAELNLFTVSLFLLCAVRVDNPLNLLVLDDPLQNMDELTVTMLARGLSKIVRLWGECGRDWQVMMLFHGEKDLERFRTEVPSAVYYLPWLMPDGHRESRNITQDPRTSNPEPGTQDFLRLTRFED